MDVFMAQSVKTFTGNGSAIIELLQILIVGGLFTMLIGSFGNKNGALMMGLVTILAGIKVIAVTCYDAVVAIFKAGGLN